MRLISLAAIVFQEIGSSQPDERLIEASFALNLPGRELSTQEFLLDMDKVNRHKEEDPEWTEKYAQVISGETILVSVSCGRMGSLIYKGISDVEEDPREKYLSPGEMCHVLSILFRDLLDGTNKFEELLHGASSHIISDNTRGFSVRSLIWTHPQTKVVTRTVYVRNNKGDKCVSWSVPVLHGSFTEQSLMVQVWRNMVRAPICYPRSFTNVPPEVVAQSPIFMGKGSDYTYRRLFNCIHNGVDVGTYLEVLRLGEQGIFKTATEEEKQAAIDLAAPAAEQAAKSHCLYLLNIHLSLPLVVRPEPFLKELVFGHPDENVQTAVIEPHLVTDPTTADPDNAVAS